MMIQVVADMKGAFSFGVSNFHLIFPSFLNLTLGVTSVFCHQRSPLLGLGPAPGGP